MDERVAASAPTASFLLCELLKRFRSTRVICRGILASLSALYRRLLQLLGEVADARPMPFLAGFSLPVDMSPFLPPSDAFLQPEHFTQSKPPQDVQQAVLRRAKEDLGVAISRGTVFRGNSVTRWNFYILDVFFFLIEIKIAVLSKYKCTFQVLTGSCKDLLVQECIS